MAKERNKQPREGAVPGQVKQARAVEPSYMDRKASWRLSRVQRVDPYGWHRLSFQTLAYIQDKLAEFESMTWSEIFIKAKKQNHSIAVAELRCEEARKWMQKNMPDYLELWTLRISGKERIWGVFAEGAYLVVFWDPEHLIYPTNK